MSVHFSEKAPIRQKLADEFTRFFALALYLYISFGAILLLKTSILREAGISYAAWGTAAIKALVLAKFMMVGDAIGLGRRYQHLPLIWPTLHRSFQFLVLLLILTAIEEIALGMIHGRPLDESLQQVVGPFFLQGVAICLVMFLILLPYSAFQSLANVIGESRLARMFFVARDDRGL